MNEEQALVNFKNFLVSRSEIEKTMSTRLRKVDDNFKKAEVNTSDLIFALETYKNEKITGLQLIEWVNFIWFSDFYYYKETQEDCIASVFSELEQGDEDIKYLSPEMIERYISALHENREML